MNKEEKISNRTERQKDKRTERQNDKRQKYENIIQSSINRIFIHQPYLIFQGIKALSSHTVIHIGIGTDGNMLVYYLGSTCQTRTVRKKRQIKDIARGRGSGSVHSGGCRL